MINRVAPEVVAENHRIWARKTGGGEPPPPPANIKPVLYLTDPFRIPFRGRMWEIPPVSFKDGARTLALITWIEESVGHPDRMAEGYQARMTEIVQLIRRLVRPHRGRLRKLLWRLRLLPNPWRTASHQDLGEMLGFFWRRRTMSPDRRRIPGQDLPRA